MHVFEGNGEVKQALEGLLSAEKPLAQLLAKGSGRREDRYLHTLSATDETEAVIIKPNEKMEQRMHVLEAKLEALQICLEALGGDQF